MKIPFWPKFKGFRDIDLGLDRMYQALKRLDDPHLKLPEVIHIAGTNGKGSTLAFLRSIFEEGGYKVHAYSSPHLVNFNERIYLAGNNISDDFLNECLKICKEACEVSPKIELTFFEGTTLAAFLAFSKVDADILILETGMGGRLDATNVLDRVFASIITPIGIDHSEFLGDSLKDIAFEKAGILKKKCLTICGKQKSEAFEVVKKRADELGCEFLSFGRDFEMKEVAEKWAFLGNFDYKIDLKHYYKSAQKVLQFCVPRYLDQKHQLENLSSVISLILAQNHFSFDFGAINRGILNAKWPARLEKIEKGQFFDEEYELFIDGGHNGDASEVVARFLGKFQGFKIVIFSMLEDKDFKEYLSQIAPKTDLLIACNIKNSVKNRSIDEVCNFANELGLSYIKSNLIEDAIMDAKEFLNQNDIENSLVLVAGSLYLAGNFIEKNS